MNFRGVFRLIAFMLILVTAFMLVSAAVGWAYGDDPRSTRALLVSCLISALVSAVILPLTKGEGELSRRDGFLVVVFGWLTTTLLGALPFYLSGTIPDFMGALFETMSGLTTTGASVMANLESMPRGILFWRAVTHLLGGMGVLVLCVAILPFLGMGGMQIYRAEVPGPTKDRLSPRIATTAKMLWGIYVILIVVLTGLLRLGGMNWFDAVCHAFATIATGGFSTRTDSIAAYHSVYIESVIIVFMFLAGVNFALHYGALTGNVKAYWRNTELRFFAGWMVSAVLFTAVVLWTHDIGATFASSLRMAAFQVVSCGTTTGFCTEDFNLWPAKAQLIIIASMLAGACCGSTSGALKNLRVVVMLKSIVREVKLFMRPQSVLRIKLNGEPLEQENISNIISFIGAYVLVFLAGFLAMLFFTPDFTTAASSVIATLGGVGPGLSRVGPMETYGWIPAGGKAVLIVCMLGGRLEFYSLLVLFLPGFWKR